MTAVTENILDQAMSLDVEERSELIARLLDSVGDAVDPGYEEAWAADIAVRVADHTSRADPRVDWEVVRAELLSDEGEDRLQSIRHRKIKQALTPLEQDLEAEREPMTIKV